MQKLFLLIITYILLLASSAHAKGIVTTIDADVSSDFALDEKNSKLYAVTDSSDGILVIETVFNGAETAIPLMDKIQNLLDINQNTEIIYGHRQLTGGFTNPSPPAIVVVDVNSSLETTQFFDQIGSTNDIDVDSKNNLVFTCGGLFQDGKLRSIDGSSNEIIDQITVGKDAVQLAIDDVNNKVFTLDSTSSSIHVVDVMSGMLSDGGTISLGDNVSASRLEVNPNTDRAYVNDFNGNSIIVINTMSQKVIDTISLDSLGIFISQDGGSPVGIAVDPVKNKIYVGFNDKSQTLPDSVLAIDGNTLTLDEQTEIGIATISEMKVDTNRNNVYILDDLNDQIIVVGGSLVTSSNGGNDNGSSGDNSSDTSDDSDSEPVVEKPAKQIKTALKDLKQAKKAAKKNGAPKGLFGELGNFFKTTKKFLKKTTKQCKRKIKQEVEAKVVVSGIDALLNAVDGKKCGSSLFQTTGSFDSCINDTIVDSFKVDIEPPLGTIETILETPGLSISDFCNVD